MRFCLIVALTLSSVAALAVPSEVERKITEAMNSESRPEADVVRDWDRSPLETLTFLRLQDDMRVLELLPGGGWYTRILAPVLRENGELYVAIAT
ncbi:MAG: methyltransferase, partial [Woeseiaceae bacterium]